MEKTSPIHLVSNGDFGAEFGDEAALLAMLAYEELTKGSVKLVAVVGNGAAAERRTRLARSMLDAVGRSDIPAGVGHDPQPNNPNSHQRYEFRTDYPVSTEVLPSAREVHGKAFDNAPDGGVTWLLHSPMSDAAEMLEEEPQLCKRKIGHIVLQAGVATRASLISPDLRLPELSKNGMLLPDDSFNNACDPEAAKVVYERIQSLNVPATFVSRHAILGRSWIDPTLLKVMAAQHPVGLTIAQRAIDSADAHWRAVNKPTEERRDDPVPCNKDRKHLVDTLMGGKDPGVGGNDSIRDYFDYVHQYDALAVLAAIPGLKEKLFFPWHENINGTEYELIGLNRHAPCTRLEVAMRFALNIAPITYLNGLHNNNIPAAISRFSDELDRLLHREERKAATESRSLRPRYQDY